MNFISIYRPNRPFIGKMWQLIPGILYLACVQGHHHRQPNNRYSAVFNNNDLTKLAPYSYYPGQGPAQQPQYNYVSAKQYPDNPTAPLSYNHPAQKQPQYMEDPYYNAPLYHQMGMQDSIYRNADNLHQPQSHTRQNLATVVYPFDLDDSNDPDMDVDPKTFLEGPSYFADLELIEHFGNYLKRRTYLDGSSTTFNDAAYQYNALFSVIIALARVVRNSCADFDQVYDQVYSSTVDTYYNYGLTNADKVAAMIEEYIRKGNSHMPKLRKLKQELCEKELFCSVSLDNKVKASPLLYAKELETLEALSHLARSYYPYIEEFNQAAQKGIVLSYLQNSKHRLREYIMHVVNSVEHLSDKAVKCT